MRKSTTALMVAAVIIAVLMLSGCTSWFQSAGRPANEAIGVANGHLEKASAAESSATAASASLQNVPYTKAGAADALKLTTSILASLDSERGELVAAKAAMDGVAKLGVEDVLKQYAKLESAAVDARIALADAKTRLFTAFERLYDSLSGTLKGVDNQETITAIQLMQQEVTSLGATAAAAAKIASDFFTASNLGG